MPKHTTDTHRTPDYLSEPRDKGILSRLISERLSHLASQDKMTFTITNRSTNSSRTYTEYDPSTKLTVLLSRYFKGFPHTEKDNHVRFDIVVPYPDVAYRSVVLPLEAPWDADVRLRDLGVLDSDELLIQNVEIVPVDEFQVEFPSGEVIGVERAAPQEQQPERMDVDEPEQDDDEDKAVVVKKEILSSQNVDLIPVEGDDGITRDDPIVLTDESQEGTSTSLEMPPGNQEQNSVPVVPLIVSNATQPSKSLAETPPKSAAPAPTKDVTTSRVPSGTTTTPSTLPKSLFKLPASQSKHIPLQTNTSPFNPQTPSSSLESRTTFVKIKPKDPSYKAHSFKVDRVTPMGKLIEQYKRKLPDPQNLGIYGISLFHKDRELDTSDTLRSIPIYRESVVFHATVVIKVMLKFVPVGFDGPIPYYRVSRTIPLSKMIKKYLKDVNIEQRRLRFLYQGTAVDPHLTVDEIGLENGESVEAWLHPFPLP